VVELSGRNRNKRLVESGDKPPKLGRFCGNGPGLWLRMQQACDLWRAERELGAELERIPVHRASPAA